MAVWMLHPIELNKLGGGSGFFNTWTERNPAHENCRLPFHRPDQRRQMIADGTLLASTYPLAVQASAVDRRVVVQRSCFTIHGTDERDFETMHEHSGLSANGYFRKFIIPRRHAAHILNELADTGVSSSTVYPDFAGLASELKFRFGPPPSLRHCP